MRISDVLNSLIGTRYTNCPNEADVLAYAEDRLSPRNRAQIERHFANCHDCLEVVAFLGRQTHETPAPLTEEAVSAHTERVLGYIRNDIRGSGEPVKAVPGPSGFHISYPKLATVGVVISAIAVAIIFTLTGQSPSDAAMDALKYAVKNTRYTEPRVSGGFEYSPYARALRGDGEGSDTVLFDRAEIKAKAAARDSTDANAGLIWARYHLARGSFNEANQAVLILEQLLKTGVETPEALNDLGVAQYQLLNYDEAIGYFTRALAKSPGYGEALFNRALAYQRLNRDADARQDWQQFIGESADNGWRKEAMTHLNDLRSPDDR